MTTALTADSAAGTLVVPTPRAVPRTVFVVTTFVGSFLLFQVQPMVARMALPDLGGASAVWNSAMLVYQALLLAGYGWAHWLRRFPVRRQVLLHGGLLLVACLWLPIGLASFRPPTGSSVVLFVPALLLASVGPVILAVSSQAPLVQQWYGAGGGVNPYPLYAASNLGSFAGLLAYPFVVEPLLGLGPQRWSWTAGYAVLILLVTGCGVLAARHAARPASASVAPVVATARPSRRTLGTWIVLSAVPSGLMLSTTTHLSTDIMAMPLLWALPLGLYLLSFSIAFADGRRAARLLVRLAPFVLVVGGATALRSGGAGSYLSAGLALVTLFVVAVALHSRLYDARPATDRLTDFYLATAVGGIIGGIFCALVAPLVFDWGYEHPLLLVAAAALLPLRAVSSRFDLGSPATDRTAVARRVSITIAVGSSVALAVTTQPTLRVVLMLVLVAMVVVAVSWRLVYLLVVIGLMAGMGGKDTVAASFSGDRVRSYFGIYAVEQDEDATRRVLVHGQTIHGLQLLGEGRQDVATTYYGAGSGVGRVLSHAEELFGDGASVGVVGLGAGTLACYRQPGQDWTFYEIDPVVVQIARDSGQFSFLDDCVPDASIKVGDARLELTSEPDDRYDVLVVDAFSSDAIPTHLMTREAFDGYDRVVRDDGLVVVHITNRFIDLEPVLAGLVEDDGWTAAVRRDEPSDAAAERDAVTGSVWVVLSREPGRVASVVTEVGGAWRALSANRSPRLWTDDHASVLPLLK